MRFLASTAAGSSTSASPTWSPGTGAQRRDHHHTRRPSPARKQFGSFSFVLDCMLIVSMSQVRRGLVICRCLFVVVRGPFMMVSCAMVVLPSLSHTASFVDVGKVTGFSYDARIRRNRLGRRKTKGHCSFRYHIDLIQIE